MIQSKFDISGMAVAFLLVFLIPPILIVTVYEWLTGDLGLSIIQKVVLSSIAFVVGPMFLLIELPKLKSVAIDATRITVRHLLTRRTKYYYYESVDGFKTSIQSTRAGIVYEIIVFKRDMPILLIPSNIEF